MYNSCQKEGLIMKNTLNEARKEFLFTALLYAVFGILLLVFPKTVLITIVKVIGWILIVFGLIEMYIFFIRRTSLSSFPLIIGIPSILFGIWFARSPESIISFIGIVAGIMVIFSSILQIQQSLVFKDLRVPRWTIMLVGAIITLVVGVILCTNPVDSISTLMKVCGFFLIVQSIEIFIGQAIIHRASKNIEDAQYTERPDD